MNKKLLSLLLLLGTVTAPTWTAAFDESLSNNSSNYVTPQESADEGSDIENQEQAFLVHTASQIKQPTCDAQTQTETSELDIKNIKQELKRHQEIRIRLEQELESTQNHLVMAATATVFAFIYIEFKLKR